MPQFTPDPKRARRAIGAMFFFVFGGAWLSLYTVAVTARNPVALIGVAVATAALFLLAYRRYRQNRPALAPIPTPQQRRTSRVFSLVNVGQWVLILIAGNILANMGLSNWVIPCVILIVGLHFLPLGHVFAYPPHYVTGAALMALAVAYPFLAAGGPSSPVGCLGAGLILWASAIWAVTNHSKAEPPLAPIA